MKRGPNLNRKGSITKLCTVCRNVLIPTVNWRPTDQRHNTYRCKKCANKVRTVSRKKNQPHKLIQYNRTSMRRLKQRVISHYSPSRTCARCGYSDTRALSIDHMSGGGEKHRREIGVGSGYHFYRWLIRNNYPSGYQVLCLNCQWIAFLERGRGNEFGVDHA